jgi:hypothetical protein
MISFAPKTKVDGCIGTITGSLAMMVDPAIIVNPDWIVEQLQNFAVEIATL